MPDIKSTRPKPYVFVLIPFEKSFDDIYKFGIKGAANDVGAYADRLDEQIFTEGMLDRIFNQISKADVVVADMTGRNPNVFYEVGYAHALGKIVLLLTQNSNDIPFDLKHRQHTVYSGSIDTLKSDLITKLQWAISEARNRQDARPSEMFSLHVLDVSVPRTGTNEKIPIIESKVTLNNFSLPIRVRNDSLETTSAINYIYLFCEPNVALSPYVYSSAQVWQDSMSFASYSIPQAVLPILLQPFTAIPVDAKDDLTNEFRLQSTIPALPPGAIEIINIPLMFTKQISEIDSLFRLRLHSSTTYHDFTFRLKFKYEPEVTQNKSSDK